MKNFWTLTEGMFCCLIDEQRTLHLKRAIEAAVAPGDVVVDAGSGSGILALMALAAGARTVYAIENDAISLDGLHRIAARDPRLIVLHGDAGRVSLPEKADVIIAELIATGLIGEFQVPVMNNLLKSATPDVKVVIQGYRCTADLVEQKNMYYGHRLDIVRYEYPDFPELVSRSLTTGQLYLDIDFRKTVRHRVVRAELSLAGIASGTTNGLRISGETLFFGGATMGGSFAYSFPMILPLEPLVVEPGGRYRGHLSYRLCGGFKSVSYGVVLTHT